VSCWRDEIANTERAAKANSRQAEPSRRGDPVRAIAIETYDRQAKKLREELTQYLQRLKGRGQIEVLCILAARMA
jgi:hypothetical protein